MNKIAVITGGTSGVGKKTAIDLAKNNMTILLIGRNKEKGKQAKEEIIQLTGNTQVTFYSVDLTSKEDIDVFSNKLQSKIERVDILVNAAGAFLKKEEQTKNGYNKNFVVNYLGHFWLTESLLPLLKQSEQGRILTVGGLPMLINRGKKNFPSFQQICSNQSNMIIEALTAKVLYTKALSRRLSETSVTVNIFHPGFVTDSNYASPHSFIGSLSYKIFGKLLGMVFNVFSETNPKIGLKLALDKNLSTTTGKFFNEKGKIIQLSSQYTEEKIRSIVQFSQRF
ncbi:SDR family NAD(P)-dependent oxidoreductase [Staphylococcus sp. ACRSN]|uniref:SDR family NAD(P)-dependent oxidoreductase n=1 Tax=Staphylococcus sp. ACRSN TaxID=2918214 RepID=UPI001EF32082|nr:SDR family NAD(P)-dependent oxidoreductase [Staphylococcus sp. ACRSN]MCG7338937.1 SDR family NAD(P)-dependent oxidoreductase [Staphylococcus sp. ACRSN]